MPPQPVVMVMAPNLEIYPAACHVKCVLNAFHLRLYRSHVYIYLARVNLTCTVCLCIRQSSTKCFANGFFLFLVELRVFLVWLYEYTEQW